MTKYKEGDLVTIRIDDEDADELNANSLVASYQTSQIIKHEPAPEPIVGYLEFIKSTPDVPFYGRHRNHTNLKEREGKTIIKLTYCTVTGVLQAEVV